MAEISSLKRQREEEENLSTQVGEKEEEIFKCQKSYKDIITLLEEEEDVPNEDLSSLISTLQEEISCSSSSSPSSSTTGPGPAQDPPQPGQYENPSSDGSGSGSGSGFRSGEEEEEKESVMRHLLEASDDELGLPNTNNVMDGFDEIVVGGGQLDGGDFFLPDGLWEFEDHEAANYYSMLQLQQSCEIFL